MSMGAIGQNTLTELLREDHRRMKDLFGRFEGADAGERARIVKEAMHLIAVHDVIEKRLLYPEALETEGVSRELVLQCKEAHHVVNILMTELKVLPHGERSFAKFHKLADGVIEHMEEEEEKLFPALESSGIDLSDLGRRMEALKEKIASGRSIHSYGGGLEVVAGLAVLGALGWVVYRLTGEDS